MSYSAGCLLREILAARNLTQAALAASMRRPAQMVSEIVTGKKKITAVTAMQLEDALEIPAEVWMAVQAISDVHQATPWRN